MSIEGISESLVISEMPLALLTRFSALKHHPPGLEKLPSGDEDKQIETIVRVCIHPSSQPPCTALGVL